MVKLITGGAFQGKRAFARERYGFKGDEITDCECLSPDDFSSLKCVYHYHLFLRRQMKEQADVLQITKDIAAANPDLIILLDEIGCGIIPMERFERQWREAVGRVGCYLAAHAESVERVVCGCGVRIK